MALRRRGCAAMSLALITGTFAAPGCASLFEEHAHLDFEVPPEQLRRIEPIDLVELATAPPVSVDEAAAEILDRLGRTPSAPVVQALTVEEVRAAALSNNLDLRVELVEPAFAATFVDEEEARFESTFTASARHIEVDSPTALGTEGTQLELNQVDLGVRVPLRTGGTIDVSFPFSDTETNNPFALLNPSYEAALGFSISQPLLRNAGAHVNLHGVRVARGQHQIAMARTKLEAIRILANAERTYWLLYAARRQLEVRQQEYELAVEQLRAAQRRVEAGDVPEIEVVRAESGVAGTLEAIILAEALVRRRQRDLKRIINIPDLPLASRVGIVTETDPDPLWLELDGDVLSAYAIANRMEMLELELQLAIDASAVDFERNQALPLFVLDYSYNLNGLGTSYGDAFDQIPPSSFSDWSIGMSVEIPLGNEAAEARVDRALLTRLQRLATRQQRELVIRQEVLDALDTLEESWQRILAARQEARLAGLTYEAERRQFQVGLRTSTDVLDAATRLGDAQAREVRALADYQIARVDLAFATGTLLGQMAIEFE